jgi:hypothetical protein
MSSGERIMSLYVEKSGTGIEKSGTGVERSGTGIEKSGTGINRSGTRCTRRPRLLQAMLGAAVLGTAAIAQAGQPNLLLSHSDSGIQVSMHVDQRMVVGQVQSAGPLSGLVTVNLYDVQALASAGIQTYGSGTGEAGNCVGGSTQTYGSGTGGSTDTYGSGTGGSTDTYGSGTGGSTDTYGSGTGWTDTYGSGTGETDTYGSGTGWTDTYGSGTGETDTYGSGTGWTDTYGSGTGETDTYGSGTGWTDTYGSGTGSPDGSRDSDAAGCGAQIARWGPVELVIDPDATYVLVHRDTREGSQEVLATMRPAATAR